MPLAPRLTRGKSPLRAISYRQRSLICSIDATCFVVSHNFGSSSLGLLFISVSEWSEVDGEKRGAGSRTRCPFGAKLNHFRGPVSHGPPHANGRQQSGLRQVAYVPLAHAEIGGAFAGAK